MLMGLVLTYSIINLDQLSNAYQFWFIKDLAVLVIFAPLIHQILKGLLQVFTTVILSLWLLNYWPVYIPSVAALTFFCSGAYLSYSNINQFWVELRRIIDINREVFYTF
jgi:hypothetical protein